MLDVCGRAASNSNASRCRLVMVPTNATCSLLSFGILIFQPVIVVTGNCRRYDQANACHFSVGHSGHTGHRKIRDKEGGTIARMQFPYAREP